MRGRERREGRKVQGETKRKLSHGGTPCSSDLILATSPDFLKINKNKKTIKKCLFLLVHVG